MRFTVAQSGPGHNKKVARASCPRNGDFGAGQRRGAAHASDRAAVIDRSCFHQQGEHPPHVKDSPHCKPQRALYA